MKAQPLQSTTKYLKGREREILRTAIIDGDEFICEIRSPFKKTLDIIVKTTIKALEDGQQTTVRTAEPAELKA